MNFNQKNINKCLIIFLCAQPIIDLITSLGIRFYNINISAGMIIRCIFLIASSLYFLFFSHSKYKKISIIYIGLITLYVGVYLYNSYYFKGVLVAYSEIKALLKAFYFPILLVIFWNAIYDHSLNIKNYVIIKIAYVYTGIIFLAQLTNTQFISYSNGKLGHVGWFYAPNEIGAILAILSPLIIYNIIQNRKSFLHYLTFIIYIFSLLVIGTKVPFWGLMITIVSFIFIYIAKVFIEKKNYTKILISPLLVSIVLVFIILPNSPIGYNINLHLKWLNVNKIDELYKPKYETELTNFLLSSRDEYLKETRSEFRKLAFEQKLLGIGYYTRDGQSDKLIEMDYHDVFYRNGIIGFILYFSSLIMIIGYFLKKVFLPNELLKVIIDLEIISYIVGLILSLSIALIAGHVLLAPAVSIYIIILILLINNRLNQILNEK